MKSLRSSLYIGLALMGLLFIAQAFVMYWGQRTIQSDVVAVADRNTIASSSLSELAVLSQQVRRYEKEYFVYVGNVERREAYIKEWTNTSNKMAALLASMRKNSDNAFTAEDQGKIGNWASAAEFYDSEMKRIFFAVNDRQARTSAAEATPPPAAKGASVAVASGAAAAVPTPAAMFSSVEVNGMIGPGKDRLSSVLIKGVAEMYATKTKATLDLGDTVSASFNRVWLVVGVTVALGLLLAAYLAWLLPRSVAKPVADLTAAVDKLSKGDLEQSVGTAEVKEFVGLSAALERMRIAQRTLVLRMRATRGG
ncbi:MAG: HAMP domain-containing protein [Betaproteobacteria bacterium]|nr:MAG: HAMP domain-containing protein [Betaproteobacteria bacterium]